MSKIQEKLDEVTQLTEQLKERYPDEINAFFNFLKTAEKGPALSKRDAELINVGLAVAAQCEWCIAFHVKEAADAGAGRDEIMEAGFMAVVMHGGPALMYLTPLIQAMDEFIGEPQS